MTTSSGSECNISSGCLVTGGSWRCTRWHTKSLWPTTVDMSAALPFTARREWETLNDGFDLMGMGVACNDSVKMLHAWILEKEVGGRDEDKRINIYIFFNYDEY